MFRFISYVHRFGVVLAVFVAAHAAPASARPDYCDPVQIEELSGLLATVLSRPHVDCRENGNPGVCRQNFIRWRAENPPVIDLLNPDAVEGGQFRGIVRDFVAQMHDPKSLPIRFLETRTNDTEIGNVLVFFLTAEVKAMAAQKQWEATRQARFDAFQAGQGGPIYTRATFDVEARRAAFMYILPDHPEQDLQFTVPRALLFALGLPDQFFAQELTAQRILLGMRLTRLFYGLSASELDRIKDGRSARQVMAAHCAAR